MKNCYLTRDTDNIIWLHTKVPGQPVETMVNVTALMERSGPIVAQGLLAWAVSNLGQPMEHSKTKSTPELEFFSAICKGRPMDKALEEFRQTVQSTDGLIIKDQQAKIEQLEREVLTEKQIFRSIIGAGFKLHLKALAKDIHETAVSKGWWETDRNDGEMVMLMVSELAEGFEYLRNHDGPSDHIPDFKGIEEEYADLIIRVLDACHKRGYRIGPAILAKMAFNKTRPMKHGGKKF